jgi:hypothetical protein
MVAGKQDTRLEVKKIMDVIRIATNDERNITIAHLFNSCVKLDETWSLKLKTFSFFVAISQDSQSALENPFIT